MIKIKNLTIQYNNNTVIKNCCLDFNDSTINAIIGKSGSGKTSILNALALEYDSKEMDYNTSFNENINLLKRYRIAYLKQGDNYISQITCFDNMQLIANISNKNLNDEKITDILKKVHLEIDKKTYPQNLSGGEKQRFAIALALIKDADIIICDEITASLDEHSSQMILDILKKLAHNDKKTIILSSHNEEIYEQCDCIYKIEDCEVYKIKSCTSENTFIKSKDINLIPLKNTTLYRYIISKMKKQKVLFTSYLILISLIVSIVGVGFFAGKQFSNQLEKMLDILNTNQSLIMNTMSTSGLRGYSQNNLAIEDKQLDKIKNISDIQEIIPYLTFDWPDFITTIDHLNEEKALSHLTISITTSNSQQNQVKVLENRDFSIHSSYHEYEMDYSCIQVNKDIDGVYLRKDIADTLGINDIQTPTEIEFDIYVPVASKNNNDYRSVVYAKTTIKKMVRGILHPTYSHFYGNAIYLSYEEMSNIANNLTEKYSIPEGYEKYTNNIYSIYTNKGVEIEDIQTQLNDIDPHLYIYNSKVNLNQSMAPFLESEQYYNIYSISLFIVAIVVSLIYSLLSNREYRKENNILKSWGLTNRETQKLIIVETIIVSGITFLLSTLLCGIMMFFLRSSGKIMINELNQNLIGISIIIIFGLALITSLCSHLSLFLINMGGVKK